MFDESQAQKRAEELAAKKYLGPAMRFFEEGYLAAWHELNSEMRKLVEALQNAQRYFYLMLIPPKEPPKHAADFSSLWERDKRDAHTAFAQIEEALKQWKEGE